MGQKLSPEEWLELDKEAHEMDPSEFDKFAEDPVGVMFGDRINLIRGMQAKGMI